MIAEAKVDEASMDVDDVVSVCRICYRQQGFRQQDLEGFTMVYRAP